MSKNDHCGRAGGRCECTSVEECINHGVAQAAPDYGRMSVDMAIEACAKVADDFAAYEQTVVDRAHADEALSDTGRKSIVAAAGSRQVAAEQIAHDIRALAAQPPAAPVDEKRARWCAANNISYDDPTAGPPVSRSSAGTVEQAIADIPDGLNWLIGKGKTRPDEPPFGVQLLRGLKIVAETEGDDLCETIKAAIKLVEKSK